MLDQLLKGLKISPETARSVIAAVAGEARDVGGDLLGATVGLQVQRMLRPQLLEMRNQLLAAIAAEPPAGFAPRMRLRYPEITDAQIEGLWADLLASLAEQRGEVPAA